MLILLALCALCGLSWGQNHSDVSASYSYSPAVGQGGGTSYSISGDGPITAVRVWELSSAYITGFQFKFGFTWYPVVGRSVSNMVEMSLFEDEAIIQVSGKYNPSNYIYQLRFVTNRGRFLTAGQPTAFSFNMYPEYSESELRLLSGRFNTNGITSLAAHWGTLDIKSH